MPRLLAPSLVLVSLSLLVSLGGCGGGGGSGGGADTIPDPSGAAITRGDQMLLLSYHGEPVVGRPLTISFEMEDDGSADSIKWLLTSQPAANDEALDISADRFSATLTPGASGEYVIRISATVDGEEVATETNFAARTALAYDTAKVVRSDPATPLDETIGIVSNQLFVYAPSRSESELRTLLEAYPVFAVVGYSDLEGLLVEFDERDAGVDGEIDRLKGETGVASVDSRVHEGEFAPRLLRTPDDGSAFNNAGDNWQLEQIGAVEAWDSTTGSLGFYIGVVDRDFYKRHEDMKGRFIEVPNVNILNRLREKVIGHGNNVAGAIAAITDNGIGVSGVNWRTQIVAERISDGAIARVLGTEKFGRKVPLVNNSWAIAEAPPRTFDPANDAHLVVQLDRAFSESRKYRKMATGKFRDKLMVWAGGNGVGGGVSDTGVWGVDAVLQNGALHFDEEGGYSNLDNVIVVAAVLQDSRLSSTSVYGRSVDIAAPTKYKAPEFFNDLTGASDYAGAEDPDDTYGNNNSAAGFGGTSAAAPLVTGAASLLLSIDPDISPATAKRILVESATEFATDRYNNPGAGSPGAGDKNIDALGVPIPVLNIGEAVRVLNEEFLVTIRSDPHNREGFSDEYVFFSADVINGEPPFIYEWNFGDGGTSALKSDTHKYASRGDYPVRLTVIDARDRTVVSNTFSMHVRGDAADGFGFPTRSVCPTSFVGLTIPAGVGREAVWKSFVLTDFRDDTLYKDAVCFFEVLSPDAEDWFTSDVLHLEYGNRGGTHFGCGKSANWMSGSGRDAYSWVRALNARGSSASSFQDIESVLFELLDNAVRDGVGDPCP